MQTTNNYRFIFTLLFSLGFLFLSAQEYSYNYCSKGKQGGQRIKKGTGEQKIVLQRQSGRIGHENEADVENYDSELGQYPLLHGKIPERII